MSEAVGVGGGYGGGGGGGGGIERGSPVLLPTNPT